MSQRIPRLQNWLQNRRLQTPAAILADTFRPLGLIAGEYLAALSPLLPFDHPRQQPFTDPGGVDRLLDMLTNSADDHV
ncbi:MAG: hypothetical protein J5I90_02780 [Caldilineales bacterium]|nr:hypothetical protein [Caldilineales bacterium]